MLNQVAITRLQLFLLLINYGVGSALVFLPGPIVNLAKQDSWISMLIATMIGLFLGYILVILGKLHPRKTLIEINTSLLGKYAGTFLNVVYLFYFLVLTAALIREAGDMIITIALPETPRIVFYLLAGLLLFMSSYHGIEVIARTNEVFSPFAALSLWLTIFFLIPLMDINNIKPILGNGMSPVLLGAKTAVGFPFAEMIIFAMIIPFVNDHKNIDRVIRYAIIIIGFTLTIIILTAILVLHVVPTALSIFTTYNMARLIEIGHFLTRVEAIIGGSFLLTIFAKMMVTFYATILSFSKILSINDYRPFIFPLLVIIITLTTISVNHLEEMLLLATTAWIPLSIILGFIVPILLILISKIQLRKKDKNSLSNGGNQ